MVTLEQLQKSKQLISNKRKGTASGPRGQAYTGLRFVTNSAGKKTFNFADKMWEDLKLNSRGIMVSPIGDVVYLTLVDDTAEGDYKPTILKKTGKSENGNKTNGFKSDLLEQSLVEVNLLKEISDKDITDGKPVKQYLQLEKVEVELTDGIYGVFTVVSEDITESDDDDKETEVEDESNEIVTETPVQESGNSFLSDM